ncbi:MobA/MobL family protein [Martelella lutilitoris]|uniref:MobA/MobL family protein n=1 Tax=Martelella lutilitoris TaxID=2583532 RepID=A0A7T7KNA7_9HYPH|nr:MobA/MobL family protein [Martelella lutilitoris]QQM32373.1 MobA/MobL family protein [Martelella lutilitoris]
MDQVIRIEPIHCRVKNVSRGNGPADNPHSVVAAAAYLSRTRIKDERTGRIHRYTRQDTDIVHEAILHPSDAPDWASNRTGLWNAVEAAERRKDARLAKSLEVAIPRDLDAQHWPALMETFAARFVAMGLPVHYAIHNNADGTNPHCHLLLATRVLESTGFAKAKLAALNKKSFVDDTRALWADTCNLFLAAAGAGVRFDHRSYKARGIAKVAGTHRGRRRPDRSWMREISMRQRPTPEDIERYPHLTALSDWPPRTNAPEWSFSREEREELKRYIADHPEPKREFRHDDGHFEDWIKRKWQEQEEARQPRVIRLEPEQEGSEPTPEERQRQEEERQRDEEGMRRDDAARLPVTQSESERLAEARKHGDAEVQRVEKQILEERLAYLERKDWDDYAAGMERRYEEEYLKSDHTTEILRDTLGKAEADRLLKYAHTDEQFRRIFKDPEHAIKRFNLALKDMGEKRALEVLVREPNRISPTKDSWRATFQHSTLEREEAREARRNVTESYQVTKEAVEKERDARRAAERHEEERQWKR